MQAGELLMLIKNPFALKQDDMARLERITADFPYFQTAQMLLCMAARKWDASVYQNQLKRTAIMANSRTHLYELIKKVEKNMMEEVVDEEKKAPVKQQTVKDSSTEEELKIVQANSEISERNKSNQGKALTSTQDSKLPEDFLEKEIQKQITVAVVDKEIISSEDETPKSSFSESEVLAPPAKEPGSFSEWLELLKKPHEPGRYSLKKEIVTKESSEPQAPPITSEPQNDDPQKAKRLKQKALIDKIIESSPGVIRPKEEQKFYTPERKAKESLLENEHLVTETLAKIYAMQGNISKAIRSYEILSLKYPQKSAYFASLIQKLKQNQ